MLKTIGLSFLLLTLPACSMINTGYNNAQELMYWWLDGYVSFTPEQKPIIKAELQALHTWHRFNEIPAYTQLLAALQQKAAHDIQGKQVCELAEEVREHFRILNLQFEPVIEKLAPTLTTAQLAHLQKRFEKHNKKWRQEWIDGSQAQRDERRLKRLIKRAEMFYGKLSSGQRSILQENIRISTFNPDISYTERLRRQQDAIATLQKITGQKLETADIKLEIAAYFDRLQHGDDAAYQDYTDRLIVDACTGMAKLHNASSQEQRKRAAEKLASYIQELEALKSSAQLGQ